MTVLFGLLLLAGFAAGVYALVRGPAPSDWEYTRATCYKDAGRECPYRIRVTSYGGLEVDTQSLVACCKFEETLVAVAKLKDNA